MWTPGIAPGSRGRNSPSAAEKKLFRKADGVGFEPTNDFRRCRFSRPVHSTALPPIPIKALANCHSDAGAWPPAARGFQAGARTSDDRRPAISATAPRLIDCRHVVKQFSNTAATVRAPPPPVGMVAAVPAVSRRPPPAPPSHRSALTDGAIFPRFLVCDRRHRTGGNPCPHPRARAASRSISPRTSDRTSDPWAASATG